ncbi:uncharacterized protein LOC144711362 [Wolffia australiana]
MSRSGKSARMDLRVSVPARRVGPAERGAERRAEERSASVSPMSSPASSCVSSEETEEGGGGGGSPEATSMMLVGCPRCLMYVMLSENEPKCPKCKSSVLLDFLNDPRPPSSNAPQPRNA